MTEAATLARKADLSWLGIFLVTILAVPGYFVGLIASYVYNFFVGGILSEGVWLFRLLDLQFLNVGLGVWFITALHGFIMGAFAGGIGTAILNRTRARFTKNVVVYSAATLLIGLGVLAFVSHWQVQGVVNFHSVALVGLIVGCVLGLGAASTDSTAQIRSAENEKGI